MERLKARPDRDRLARRRQDGLGAMVAAWWCADVATKQGGLLMDVDMKGEVFAYNEVDRRVMMEAVGFLRGRLASGL